MRRLKLSLLRFALWPLIATAPSLLAQPQELSVDLLTTFEYPRPVYTLAGTGQINDKGEYVGQLLQGSTVLGFTGNVIGSFSHPFAEPDDTLGFTSPSGVRDGGEICGRYDATGATHGFFRRGASFKTYDAPVANVFATTINSINNSGNFVGLYTVSGGSAAFAYASIGGNFITLPVSGNLPEANGINSLDQIVGDYGESSGAFHGFLRTSDGTFTMPIDFPGAFQTVPKAINDSGYIVGFWTDNRTSHAFVIQLPDTFLTYDVPDALGTAFTGINSAGLILGNYTDRQRKVHGFTAQLQSQ
jgi:hypothetical protein